MRVLDSFATGRRENLASIAGEIELIEGDIQSYERVHNAVRGCALVFHQAALPSVPRSIQDPLTSTTVNVMGTLNVLLASRDEGVRRVIYASSSSVFGPNPELPKREAMATYPVSPYAVSKLAAEGFCRSFTQVYGLETVALRYFNVFGPRQDPNSQYSAVIPKFIECALDGRPATVHGDGNQSRDFTFIDNVAHANLLAATAPGGEGLIGRAVNIACGTRISLNEILEELGNLVGSEVPATYIDGRLGDIPHSLADVSLAEEQLRYEPQVDFQDGLARTFEHYRELHSASVAAPQRTI